MKPKVYLYNGCGTCKRAVKFLEANKVAFTTIPIREQPPTATELRRMLGHYGGNLRKLFNTSGLDYRALKLGEKLPSMTEDEAISLLASNGNLVKRPFVLTAKGGLVGFDEAAWRTQLNL